MFKHLLLLAAILIVMSYVYADALNGQFVFDDDNALRLANTSPAFSPRWLTEETYWWDWLSGGTPEHYHTTNLMIHAINVALVYAILVAIIPSTAFWGAFIFAVHPLFAESVQYITARSSALAAMCVWGMLAAWLHLKHWPRVLVMAGCIGFAVVSKEEGLLAIPILLVTWMILTKRLHLAWITVGAVPLVLWLPSPFGLRGHSLWASRVSGLQSYQFIEAGFSNSISRWDHIQSVMNNFVWHLLSNIVWPLHLTAEPPIEFGHTVIFVLATILLIGLVSLVFIRQLDYRLRLAVALIVITPPLSRLIVPVGDAAFEYRAYLCGLGVALLVALGINALSPQYRTLAGLWIAGLLIMVTLSRNTVWSTPVTLWDDTVRQHPTPRALVNLGRAYQQAGRGNDAIRAYRMALDLHPRLVAAETNLAAAYIDKGQYAEAVIHLENAVHDSPTFAEAWTNYSCLMLRTGQIAEARRMALKALSFEPNQQVARYNLNQAEQLMAQR